MNISKISQWTHIEKYLTVNIENIDCRSEFLQSKDFIVKFCRFLQVKGTEGYSPQIIAGGLQEILHHSQEVKKVVFYKEDSGINALIYTTYPSKEKKLSRKVEMQDRSNKFNFSIFELPLNQYGKVKIPVGWVLADNYNDYYRKLRLF